MRHTIVVAVVALATTEAVAADALPYPYHFIRDQQTKHYLLKWGPKEDHIFELPQARGFVNGEWFYDKVEFNEPFYTGGRAMDFFAYVSRRNRRFRGTLYLNEQLYPTRVYFQVGDRSHALRQDPGKLDVALTFDQWQKITVGARQIQTIKNARVLFYELTARSKDGYEVQGLVRPWKNGPVSGLRVYGENERMLFNACSASVFFLEENLRPTWKEFRPYNWFTVLEFSVDDAGTIKQQRLYLDELKRHGTDQVLRTESDFFYRRGFDEYVHFKFGITERSKHWGEMAVPVLDQVPTTTEDIDFKLSRIVGRTAVVESVTAFGRTLRFDKKQPPAGPSQN